MTDDITKDNGLKKTTGEFNFIERNKQSLRKSKKQICQEKEHLNVLKIAKTKATKLRKLINDCNGY